MFRTSKYTEKRAQIRAAVWEVRFNERNVKEVAFRFVVGCDVDFGLKVGVAFGVAVGLVGQVALLWLLALALI